MNKINTKDSGHKNIRGGNYFGIRLRSLESTSVDFAILTYVCATTGFRVCRTKEAK